MTLRKIYALLKNLLVLTKQQVHTSKYLMDSLKRSSGTIPFQKTIGRSKDGWRDSTSDIRSQMVLCNTAPFPFSLCNLRPLGQQPSRGVLVPLGYFATQRMTLAQLFQHLVRNDYDSILHIETSYIIYKGVHVAYIKLKNGHLA